MRVIKLEEIRLLKQSEKSMVLLFQEMDGEQRFVQKTLQGRHEIYETLQSCPHPYLPKIHEVTISDNSTVVLEEYIDGQTLDSATLTEKQICAAVKELCVVLGFLHGKGIIHRDVKPTNIMMASDGHVRLIDFDAARRIKDNVEQDTRLMVTKGYAPPEQFGFSQTDARADVYSLGVTIEQLLGERAKKPKYKRIIRKCKDLNPNKRYQSVNAVKNAFSFGRRRFAYISAAMIMVLLSWTIMRWIPLPTAAPEDWDQIPYPEEDLLFYVKNGNYIIQSSDHITDAGIATEYMQVDMTGNGDYSDFILPHSLNAWAESGREYDIGFHIGELADELQPNFWIDGTPRSLWPSEATDALWDIPYDLSSPIYLTQITCVDADNDGIKELFVSRGNMENAILTTVWKLTDIEKKHYDMIGSMWGTRQMYLYPNGDIRAIVNGNLLNHYNYSNGVLTELTVIDFQEFKNAQAELERELEEMAAEAQSYYDSYWNRDDWTYEDIARGYRLEEDDEARLATWNTDDIVRGYRMVENENGEFEKWTYNDFVRGYRLSEEEQAAFEEALEKDRLRGQQLNEDEQSAEDEPPQDDNHAE